MPMNGRDTAWGRVEVRRRTARGARFARAAVATVSVSLGDSAIGNQEGEKIASWSAKPQGVKFVCGDEGKSCIFAAESDGLYIYRGFSVFLY